MKNCPACNTQYSDHTLNFCLQDGTPLIGGIQQSSIDTVAFSDPTTINNMLAAQRSFEIQADGSRTHEEYSTIAVAPARNAKRNKVLIGALAVIPVTIAMVAIVAVPRLYQPDPDSKRVAEKSRPEAPEVPSVETATKESVHQHDGKTASEKPVDAEAVKREVADIVGAWERAFEARSVDEYAAHYAPKVDYMGKPVTSASIRSEALKTFNTFAEMNIEVTNLLVAVDKAGDAATAVFDKEWSYEAHEKLSDGKAHTKIHLQKLDGEWKIVGEKFLKTYYIEN